tara:strand:+ start:711 stop:1019 length:309 start_codon:yes stop_codon:yes gene_type:complete
MTNYSKDEYWEKFKKNELAGYVFVSNQNCTINTVQPEDILLRKLDEGGLGLTLCRESKQAEELIPDYFPSHTVVLEIYRNTLKNLIDQFPQEVKESVQIDLV